MERLMQYVWQHRLWLTENMRTVDGRRIIVLDTGKLNTDSGPDFFNAKIKIDNQIWAGDIEIHVKASDWFRHGHDKDCAYDSVILHVVAKDDRAIVRKDGNVIPQLRMPCAPDFNKSYAALVNLSHTNLPCTKAISDISPVHLRSWLDSLAFERIYAKSERIEKYLEKFSNDWETACYITLARALGFSVNSDPFERLAMSVPIKYLGKHSDSSISIESMFFGQSGLLPPDDNNDQYVALLRREYTFLASKFNLRPAPGMTWKMSRMRPQNFPHRRIAYLAAMFFGGFRLMSRILEAENTEDLIRIFDIELMGYWTTRYTFRQAAGDTALSVMSRKSLMSLVINVAVPVMFCYGNFTGDTSFTDRAINIMQSLPPETNNITELFKNNGIKCNDAFTSQALIQLRKEYCETHKCLYCRIGHRHLSKCAKIIETT